MLIYVDNEFSCKEYNFEMNSVPLDSCAFTEEDSEYTIPVPLRIDAV